MKDEHDNHTGELAALSLPERDPQGHVQEPRQPKRPYVQSFERAHVVERSSVRALSWNELLTVDGVGLERFVPVSFVAKDWKVTPRRIRALLRAGRLAGRLQLNGYWEVRFPYCLSIGTRGPALMHQKRVAAKRSRQSESKAEQNAN